MNEDDLKELTPPPYYGKEIRLHLLLIGFFLIFLISFDQQFLIFYITIGVILVVLTVMFAGLTTRKNKSVMVGNLIISLFIFCVFEFLAIYTYRNVGSLFSLAFFLKQAIALLSMSALYLSTRTLAGMSK